MTDVLPDVLEPGLCIVFCGTAAGSRSARLGAYYAGPGNRFWSTLHDVGLTPRQLEPHEFRRLPGFGLGLTDVSKKEAGPDRSLGSFDVVAFRDRIAECAPCIVAFNGKKAAEKVLRRKVTYCQQEETIGGAEVFVLPSTSGAARGSWDLEKWHALARYARSHPCCRPPG